MFCPTVLRGLANVVVRELTELKGEGGVDPSEYWALGGCIIMYHKVPVN